MADDPTGHIDRLPGELILEIFIALEAVYGYPTSLGWIVLVTHVTGRWRRLAINYKHFWGNIQTGHLEWMQELLRRVKDADISIRVQVPGHGADYYAPLFVKASQAATIDVTASPADLNSIIETYFASADAKRLRHLSLSSPDSLHDDVAACPIDIFRGSIPTLRRLDLRQVDLKWNSSFLKNLAVLNVIDPTHKASFTQVVTALQTMPTLRHLRLTWAIENELHQLAHLPEPKATELIHLPKLEEIYLEGGVTAMVRLLDRVDAPPSTRIRVGVRSITPDGGDASFLVTALTRYKERKLSSAPPIKHLVFRCNMRCVVEMLAWLDATDKEPYIAIAFYILTQPPSLNLFRPRGLLSQLFHSLPLAAVLSLRILDGDYSTADGRYKFLQKCELVEQITVNHAGILLDLLTPSIVSNPIYEGLFPFEKLEIIQTSESGWKDALPRTVQLLKARHASGQTLDSFIMTGRPVSATASARFSKVVSDLKEVVKVAVIG